MRNLLWNAGGGAISASAKSIGLCFAIVGCGWPSVSAQESPKPSGGTSTIPKAPTLDCTKPQVPKQELLPERAAIIPEIEIKEDELLAGKYTYRKVFESGRHLFSTPYTTADGHGEGGLGKSTRQKDYEDNVAKLAADLGKTPAEIEAQIKLSTPIPRGSHLEFLRLNGLDSQSCFECHDTIGSENLSDTLSAALARKVGSTGGPAGFASTAFINPTGRTKPGDANSPVKDGEEGFPHRLFKLVRNPPHVFGTGYPLRLADEMTYQLLQIRVKTIGLALLNPGVQQKAPLVVSGVRADLSKYPDGATSFKDIDFGEYRVTFVGTKARDQKTALESAITLVSQAKSDKSEFIKEDLSGVRGVSEDLVVRPLQWKGIASNERNFVNDALNFHFGILSVEKSFQLQLNDLEQGAPFDDDFDKDGVKDELSIGNVSALTIFTMSLRPPTRSVPEKPEIAAKVQTGAELFIRGPVPSSNEFDAVKGKSSPQATACASCHIPTMRIYSNVVNAEDPCLMMMSQPSTVSPSTQSANPDLSAKKDGVHAMGHIMHANSSSLSSQRASSQDLPVYLNFIRRLRKLGAENGELSPLNFKMFQGNAHDTGEIALGFNLTTMEQVIPSGGAAAPPSNAPADTLPRLRENPEVKDEHGQSLHTIDIPLFSDLRRHDMGEGLADSFRQETDVMGIFVPERLFLTRPLWGVGDTAPFLHDGRALSLDAAILAHGSSGSEAEMLIANLTADQRQAIVQFLLTLRLPHSPRYEFDKNLRNARQETNEPLPNTRPPVSAP